MTKRKTKIATLEIDSEEPEADSPQTVDEAAFEEALGEVVDDLANKAMDIIDNAIHNTVAQENAQENTPPELTTEQENEVRRRKEQVLREAQTELDNLEDEQAEARKEVNSYKKPIADARSRVRRLISCDVHGFLRWEKEQELPLLRAAEEAANAWRNEPVKKLDVTAKDKEHLAEHFNTCGSVADWLCQDYPGKKKGLNGQVVKERLRNAIQKISGVLCTIENSDDDEDSGNDD